MRNLFFLSFVVFGTACSSMSGSASMTMISRSPQMNDKFTATGAAVSASDCTYQFLLFVMGNGNPNTEAVTQKLLTKHQADALLDAELSHSAYFFPLLFTMQCANVTGTPAVLKGDVQ